MLFPLKVEIINRLLVEIADIFSKHGTKFWLRDGTALGIYRDGTVLPYDDDADLGVWYEDLPRILPVFRDMIAAGYVLYKRTDTVFAFLKDDETIEFCVSGLPDRQEPYIAHLDSYFRDLIAIRYENVDFFIPARTVEYLEFSYGLDWRTPRIGAWLNTYWRGNKKRLQYTNEFIQRKNQSAE